MSTSRSRFTILATLALLVLLGTAWVSGLLRVPAQARAAPTVAPDFAGITHWINSPPLTMHELRGKVVLIDFWAYSCINCLRTFPHLNRWYADYKDKGLVIVGVHSPEFDFGKQQANVERAVRHFDMAYPVAMDSNMATWRAWDNQFWPAEYLVNQDGQVVRTHFGEGHYRDMENAIRNLLGLAPLAPTNDQAGPPGSDLAAIGSPEMYFGLARQQYMANAGQWKPGRHLYHAPRKLDLNRYALEGQWLVTPEYAKLTGSHGTIRLRFQAGTLHMVASSKQPITLGITVDGKRQPPVTVQASRLYTLFDSHDYRQHLVTIDIPHAGLRAFTFTFG